MRILQVVPTLQVGGAERVVALLGRYLLAEGHTVGVASLGGRTDSWIESDLTARGARLFHHDKGPGLDLRVVPRLASTLSTFRPDVIHTHLHVLKYVLPARMFRRHGAIVHTVHNLADREVETFSELVQRVAFRRWVEPVAIGAAVAESMTKLYGRAPRYTIANGIPVADYQPPPGARAEVRAALGISGDAPVMLTVGRLNRQKNHRLLLDAFASARLAELSAHLLVVGDGGLRQELERQAVALGVAERVLFLGVRDDVPRLLAAADIFVLASDWEGNPLVVMEAMSAGLPVVASSVGCVPELVVPGTGHLFAAGDKGALTLAMERFAADLDGALEQGSAAGRRAREHFDAAVMGRAYEKLYTDLL